MKSGYTYIVTNKYNSVLYTGVTSNILKRVIQHKTSCYKGFTSKYRCHKLVWFQEFETIIEAIEKEKYIKGKSREWKINLIKQNNKDRSELSGE